MTNKYVLRIATVLALFITFANTQPAPTWTTSLYIEAKSFAVVTGTQKTSGTFTNVVTFSGNYPTPSLALSIPQLRIVSNNNKMNFLCAHSNASATGFTHTLTISGTDSVVWYLSVRYFVVSLQLLPQTFQAGLINANPSTINQTVGTTRSESFSNPVASPLPFAMSLTSNATCVPFLTGVTATSADFYQLNISCAVTAAQTFTISVTVYQNTLVSNINVYVLVYDPKVLAVASVYFADYSTATTYNGAQTAFASLPFGYFDSNFIGGLASFSMVNNVQFNITLSIPSSNTVYSSASSLYDSVPQLQVRVRNCPPSFPYFNTVNSLCYAVCPSTTYSNISALACYACPTYCLTCLNSSLCTLCQTGMMLANGSCTCALTKYLYNGVCYGCDHSCLTCVYTGQFYNCLTCDATNHRTTKTPYPPYNYSCPCDSGFTDVGVAMCQQVCGDGIAIIDQCDDGNTIDGDGCSSTCTQQNNFTCVPNDICYYIGNISITCNTILKQQFSNVLRFYVLVSPWIPLMSQLANSMSLTSNVSFLSSDVSMVTSTEDPYQSYLVYSVTFAEDCPVQDEFIQIYLSPTSSGVFSRMPGANVTVFGQSSNGYDLCAYSDYQYRVAISFKYICQVFGYLILSTLPLYIFGRLKWVGNMLFLSLQFQFLNMAVVERFTPMLIGLSYFKEVMGYNNVETLNIFSITKYPSIYALNYNTQFDHNVNFMVTAQALGIVMYIIYYIAWRRNELLCKKYGGDPQKTFLSKKIGKFLNFFNWEFFMYFNIFNMTNQILSMILVSEQQIEINILPLQIFCMTCLILAIAPLFFKRDQIPSYTKLLYYKDRGSEEQLVTLSTFAGMYLLFYLAKAQNMIVYYFIFLGPLLLIVYLFWRRPFQSKWVRAAYFINNFCIIMTLIYNRLTLEYGEKIFYLPFGNFAMIVFDWVFNLVVWGREAYIICKYGGEEGLNEILQSNTKTTDQDQGKDFFKVTGNATPKNTSLLGNVLKNPKKSINTNRKQRKRELVENDDQPQHLRNERKKMMEAEQQEEQNQISKKRQQWSKQMNQMKEIRMLRQRTRQQIRKENQTPATNQSKRAIRSTRQKGIDAEKINIIDNKALNI